MYQLFNVLAWIWIVIMSIFVVGGIIFFGKRCIFGWPRGVEFMLTPYSALYGKIWIPCMLAILAALFVSFDPQLQVWVVGLTLTYMALRAVSIYILKALNTI